MDNGGIGKIAGWVIPTNGPTPIRLDHQRTTSFIAADDWIDLKKIRTYFPDIPIVDLRESDSIPFDQDGFCNLLGRGEIDE